MSASARRRAQAKALGEWVADPADTRIRADVLRDFAADWRKRTTCECGAEKGPSAGLCDPCTAERAMPWHRFIPERHRGRRP